MLVHGLTPMQHARLHEALSRMTGLPSAPLLYMDADRIAGRFFLEPWREHPPATAALDDLAATYETTPAIAGWIAGLAFGVRLGRTFKTRHGRPRRTICDEWRRLDAEQRRDVASYIRAIASGEYVFTFLSCRPQTAAESRNPEDDIAIARRFMREAGQAARARR